MNKTMSKTKKIVLGLLALALIAALAWLVWKGPTHNTQNQASNSVEAKKAPLKNAAAAGTALTVTTVMPRLETWNEILDLSGSVAAWQEALVSSELGGFRLVEVAVDVGDTVKRGQVLARVTTDTVQAELAQSQGALAEAQATLDEAKANAQRAQQLQASGALSAQQIGQYQTAEQTAQARLQSAQARVQAEQLRLQQTRITAPDDGVISARSATLGSVVQNGQELFRLIRQGRLEWQAELPAADLARVKPGMTAQLFGSDGKAVPAQVRKVAPSLNPQTRNGLVYLDVKTGAVKTVRAGMFARGQLQLGRNEALVLPQTAVVQRDGFNYVFRLDSDGRVRETKVTLGRRQGDAVEIQTGLAVNTPVVASGVGFLADGDLVKVVTQPGTQP